MSRYSSICTAIGLIEAVGKMFGDQAAREQKIEAIKRDLQDVARDVRYGGKWSGDYEIMAETLEVCANHDCNMCGYRNLRGSGESCTGRLKKDAAADIRQMAQDNSERRKMIAEEEEEEDDGDGDESDRLPY